MNRWPASAGSAASSLPPSLPVPSSCPHWGSAQLRAASSSHGGAGVGCPRPRSLGGLRACPPHPAWPIMPLLDFFWACFKRAKVRNCLFKWCPSFDTLLISGEAAGRDGGGGVSSRAGVCARCLTSAPKGCHARAPHERQRLILDGPYADALVSAPCAHPLPISDGTRIPEPGRCARLNAGGVRVWMQHRWL